MEFYQQFKAIGILALLFICSFAHAESVSLFSLNDNWQICTSPTYPVSKPLTNCQSIKLPTAWEDQGLDDYDGFARLTSQFTISHEQISSLDGITLGKIRDADKVFINGKQIGQTGSFPPNFEKATLYSRLYRIEPGVLRDKQVNKIEIWVYNNARMGGITEKVPQLGNYYALLKQQTYENYENIIFVSVLAVFSLLHLVYFGFHRHSLESFYYGVFVGCWSLYLLTYTNIVIELGLNLNWVFRANIALFYGIFISLPLFIFRFYNAELPRYLALTLAFVGLNIPFVLFVPNIDHVYLSLELIETVALIIALPSIVIIIYQSYQRRLDYSRSLNAFLILYLVLGLLDIYFDFTQGAPDIANRLLGPYALIFLNIAFSAIVYHKHWVYYQGATFDTLTGVLQRAPFMDRLTQDLYRYKRNEQRLIIIMLDLDRFKSINDTFGHIAGDQMLKAVAHSLSRSLRSFDNIARFGGDEFCISALVDKETDVKKFVERIHNAIHELELEVKGIYIKPGVTFGVLEYHPTLGDDPERLITMADDQLITAKYNNKGSILWFNESLLAT